MIVGVVALLAGLLSLAAIAWVLRFGRPGRIASPEEAAAAVEHALAGFAVADVVLGADGTGALAVSRDGRLAAVGRRRGRAVVQEVSWAAMRSTGDGTIVEMGRLCRVTLARVDALDLRRLAGQMAFPFATGPRERTGRTQR